MTETIGTYEFLSFARRGAASALSAADSLSGALPYRGAIQVTLGVESRAIAGSTPKVDAVAASILTYGPGDVVGIDPRHIVRTEPRHLATDFEPNYFAGIEFELPDFPWLFTPSGPDADHRRLRPWLALVALREDEYTRSKDAPHPLPKIVVADAKSLPDLSESWAWAHAQISGATSDLVKTIREEPGRVISRLLCPRKLDPRTRYTAFVVPAFATGVLAGNGQAVPTAVTTQTTPAWSTSDTNVVLPVYYQFEFATSERGDFESLARELTPQVLPTTVGIRPMAVPSQTAWTVPAAGKDLGLGGALRAVTSTDTDWTGQAKNDFQSKLADVVNRGASRLPDGPDDPRITPPLYGRWHIGATSVSVGTPGWLTDLNLDPRTRAMAGLGTAVVRSQRSQLLAAVWKQLGSVLEANQKLKAAQMARAASTKVHQKHLLNADADTLLAMTTFVHRRILASPHTIATTIARSRLPARALSPAFRRVTRPRGPLRRRQGERLNASSRWASRLNSGELRVVPPPHAPGGLTSIEDVSDRLLPPVAPTWLWALLPYAYWILLALAILVALAIVLVGALVALPAVTTTFALAIIGVLVAAAVAARANVGRWRTGILARLDHFTARAFAAEPPRPNFRIVSASAPLPAPHVPQAGGTDSDDAREFRGAAESLGRYFARPKDDPPDPPSVDVDGLHKTLVARLAPEVTIAARMATIVKIAPSLQWQPADPLEPVMAAPVIDTPMYEPLRDLSQDLLLPGLRDVPSSSVTLVEENHAFIEAYLVGANVELGRELLYVDFPTDQRLSTFRQFWDARGYIPTPTDPSDADALREQLRDIPAIHTWSTTNALGDNRNRADIVPGKLVLLVRGRLLQRYPSAVVCASEATWDAATGKRVLGATEKHPLFRGTLAPDLTFFGFDLSVDEARGSTDTTKPQGWWFVFQQQPSEPRFGLEPAPSPYATPTVRTWNDLSWANFAQTQVALDALAFAPAMSAPSNVNLTIGTDNANDGLNNWYDGTTRSNAAQMAYITLRRPARVAIHAEMMLPAEGGT